MLNTLPIRPEDELFLFQVYASIRSAEILAWGWDEATQEAFLTMQWKAQHRSYSLQYPNADHRIILFQNLPAGRILVSRTEQELLLVDISLLPEFCNQGIGSLLLKHLQSEASESAKPLRLSVLKSNPARRLYERLGFTTTGTNGMHDFMEWRMSTV